jgi:hypothetical protein
MATLSGVINVHRQGPTITTPKENQSLHKIVLHTGIHDGKHFAAGIDRF